MADHDLRTALVRLMWIGVADSAGCCCDGKDASPYCAAMQALGWGDHFDPRKFQRRAMKEPRHG